MNEAEYITKRLDDQISWFDKKSQHCQKWYKWLNSIAIIALLLSPIINLLCNDYFCGKVSVLCFNAVSVLCYCICNICRYKDLWIQYRTSSELLQKEKYLYLTGTGIYEKNEIAFSILVKRAERIIGSDQEAWQETVKKSAADAGLVNQSTGS